MAEDRGFRIAIDRGGTFTDCVGNPGTDRMEDDVLIKLLSEDPSNYDDAPLEGIRRLMSKFLGNELPRGEPLDTSRIASIRMGTTVATNALLERKGERIALIVTKGFANCLDIGNQSRPLIFDLAIKKPDVLHEMVVEVDERVTLEDYAEDPDRNRTTGLAPLTEAGTAELVTGLSSEAVRILQRPDEEAVKAQLQVVYDQGIRSIAVCLMHAYTFPNHEAIVARIATEVGFEHISLSHQLMPMIKVVPRATSACADAYLTPTIKKYIAGFQRGFRGGLGTRAVEADESRTHEGARCDFMQSDGGLVDVDRFSGLKAILSGPAGGVVGYALTSYDPKTDIPVIGFDMGGTSTDVSRYGSGRYDHVFESTTAGITVQSPQLDINTVAAGGGSRLFFKIGLFVVGPESAGAHPGPACYRKGGPATITDANLYLGRLLPDFFPKIFGKGEDEGLDLEASRAVLQELTDEINKVNATKMSVDEVAFGYITVANETMTRPIRSLTEAKGHDTSKHRLATFGGAGGQHAVDIAKRLNIKQILIHRYSSCLSAYGMALADVVEERQEPDSTVWNDEGTSRDGLKRKMAALRDKAADALVEQGFKHENIVFEEFLNMRYRGTDTALMIIKPEQETDGDEWAFGKSFVGQHRQEFGFTLPNRDLLVDDVRIRAIGKSFNGLDKTVDQQLAEITPRDVVSGEKQYRMSSVYFGERRCDTPVYKIEDLDIGDRVRGPAILADGTQTIVVDPNVTALSIKTHIILDINDDAGSGISNKQDSHTIDPIMLSVFAHRFMAIAEQMGRALQKTSVSTNVKERLDYSCALFDSSGNLVANAPHLPVHLGSMSTCIRTQAKIWSQKLVKGDVIVSNHPDFGGTHLPDITVVTPAFDAEGKRILFFVASRAHHADIGGILPGSMPPHSSELYQEGASIKSEKLVSAGHFNEERMIELLQTEPARYKGCSGTRCLSDNISDLKAQVASNQKGISLISSLIEEYGEKTVDLYMRAIQDNAEQSVRSLLKDVFRRFEGQTLEAVDYMDDGSAIRLKITIDGDKGEAVFDFDGTTPQVYANINAPEAITHSAVIYSLRCLISDDIPLNQGCLLPIDIRIPKGSLLSPSRGAAVVGGNVLTSQRVTDVIFRAFNTCAASQGCCNNLTFGFQEPVAAGPDSSSASSTNRPVKGFGYYETIAGGSGAGPTWAGTSGVHVHMTNTRITDAEILERRYPVLLREFALRRGSGGAGRHRGGDGVVRDIEVRRQLTVSILSERRVHAPYGLEGGGDAQCGMNLWVRRVKVEGENQTEAEAEAETETAGRDSSTPAEPSSLSSSSAPATPQPHRADRWIERRINLGGKNTAIMQPGERIIIQTPGGGGWGPKEDGRREEGRREMGTEPEEEEVPPPSSRDPRVAWRGGSHAQREALALQS